MELKLTVPDDWHAHFRDGDVLEHVVPVVASQFGRALAMPNLMPAVVDCEGALAYRDRILAHAPEEFDVLATIYLTDRTTTEEIRRVADTEKIVGAKLYPAGATTNSDAGVTDLAGRADIFAAMAEHGLPLLVHGELARGDVDVFDREARFLDEVLGEIVSANPSLRVVVEHITTAVAVDFVRGASPNVGATITAHHLLHTRNDMLAGGIRPHYYCLPVLKRAADREALLDAATGTDRRFFLGTDSAPHSRETKENECGCAGCYTSPTALALYAVAFEERNALDRLEDFASLRGADFYGLPYNRGSITLRREPWTVPEGMPFGDATVVPFAAGQTLPWRIVARSG